MKKFVIIVAGGVGQRIGGEVFKQFLLLKEKPILLHTIERFIQAEPKINVILALKESLFDLWYETVEKYHFDFPVILSKGGKERFDTVKEALTKVPNNALVAIHDSVRPLVSIKTIKNSFIFAKENDSAIPVTIPVESIRIEIDKTFMPFNRDFVRQIQTPQTFNSDEIKKAYQVEFSPNFTDDATVYESTLSKKVTFFEGNRENIKITYPQDLTVAEALFDFVQ